MFAVLDDGKLDTESDSGEFWVLFGGFAPIGKKASTDDDVVAEATPPKLYRYKTLDKIISNLTCFMRISYASLSVLF